MFLEFFGLSDDPFKITPNPQFAYCGAQFSSLRQAIGRDLVGGPGPILLYGKSGVGKTLLLRMVQDDLRSGDAVCRVVSCACNSGLTARELIELADPELAQRFAHEEHAETVSECLTVLMLDEAQHMEATELARLLGIAIPGRVHIVLAGAPELAERVATIEKQIPIPALRRYCLEPLPAEEIARFIDARLEAAGGTADAVFSPEAVARVAVYTGGLPSQINRLCAAAMLVALLDESRCVTADHIGSGAAECGLRALEPVVVPFVPEPPPPVLPAKLVTRASGLRSPRIAAAALAACALIFVADKFYEGDFGSLPRSQVPSSQMSFAVLKEPPTVKPDIAVATSLVGVESIVAPKAPLITVATIDKLKATMATVADYTADVLDELIVASLNTAHKAEFSALIESDPVSMIPMKSTEPEVSVSDPVAESVGEPFDRTADAIPPLAPITVAFAHIDGQHVTTADVLLPLPEPLALDIDSEMVPPATGLNSVRVFIHHTAGQDSDAETARQLAHYLEENGVIVADIRAVQFRIDTGSVRYFFDINAETGATLMEYLGRFFQGNPAAGPTRLVDFTHYEPKPGWGALEVWLPTS